MFIMSFRQTPLWVLSNVRCSSEWLIVGRLSKPKDRSIDRMRCESSGREWQEQAMDERPDYLN